MIEYITDYKSNKFSIGTIFKSKTGENFIILGKSIDRVNFMCGYFEGFENNIIEIDKTSLRMNTFKNKNTPRVYGVGYFGYGKYDSKNNRKIYKTWCGMLERCYCKNLNNKHVKITYENVTVCEEWLNFQTFAEWHEVTYINNYQLDKDLKQPNIKNKIYSPDTCCWLKPSINTFLRVEFLNSKKELLGLKLDKMSNHVEVKISLGSNGTTSVSCKNINDAIIVNSMLRNFKIDEIKSYIESLNIYNSDIIKYFDYFKTNIDCIPNGYDDKIIRAKLKISKYVETLYQQKD